MPELPEVETIVRGLRPYIEGRRIARAAASRLLRALPSRQAVLRGLRGRIVTSVRRRGKYMLATLDDGQVLMVHLGMTGRLVLEPKSAPPKRHMHLAVRLAGLQAELRFYDARRFGRVGLGSLDWLASRTGLGRLGREPLDAGRGEVAAALRLGGGRIKATMLGQEVVAGLGNIYADEALFRAGIHPLRRCASLSVAESLCLESCIIRVLREAVAAGGSTIGDYVRHDGRSGSYQNSHAVYGRNGQPCPRCGQPICRIMAAGRGTHLCRRCQPRKGEGRARRGTEGISRRRSD